MTSIETVSTVLNYTSLRRILIPRGTELTLQFYWLSEAAGVVLQYYDGDFSSDGYVFKC